MLIGRRWVLRMAGDQRQEAALLYHAQRWPPLRLGWLVGMLGQAGRTDRVLHDPDADANEIMSAIHDRMPVIIPPEKYSLWLDPAEHDLKKLTGLLRPFDSDEMTAYPVSTFVNNAKHDSAQCIEPIERQWTFPI